MTDREETTTASIWDLFEGYSKTHGLYRPEAATGGKVDGRADYGNGAPTPTDWRRHLRGEAPGVGVVPLLDDGKSVRWAAIDIDDHGIDHAKLGKLVDELKLPLALSKSKSDGAHLWAFFSEPVPAALAQTKLTEIAAALGHGGCEIFPKQLSRKRADDPGNWINMPYFGQTRRGVIGGREVKLAAWVEHAWARRMTRAQLMAITVGDNEWFGDGPPCLEKLFAQGIDEGSRNTILFNVGVYLRLKHGLDDFAPPLYDFNSNELNEPLPTREAQTIAKSVGRKEYGYQCSAVPLCNFCDRSACHRRAFGVLAHEGAPAQDLRGVAAYTAEDDRFHHFDSGLVVAKAQFDNRFLGQIGGKSPSLAVLQAGEQYDGVAFRPGEGLFVDNRVNLWRPGKGVAPDPDDDCGGLLALVDHLFPSPAEREHILNYLAQMQQQPEVRPNHALFVSGGHGTGKSTLAQAMRRIVGSRWTEEIQPENVLSENNSFVSGKLLVIVNDIEERRRAADIASHLKLLIADDRVSVTDKWVKRHEIENYARWILFANDPNALAIQQGERRYFASRSTKARLPLDVRDRVWAGQGKMLGLAGFAHFLAERDISGFDPKADPPATAALAAIQNTNRSAEEEFLHDRCERRLFPFDGGLAEVVWAQAVVQRHQRAKMNGRICAKVLRELGYEELGRKRLPDGSKRTLWAREGSRWFGAGADELGAEWTRQYGEYAIRVLADGYDPERHWADIVPMDRAARAAHHDAAIRELGDRT